MIESQEKIYVWKPIEGLEGEFNILSEIFDSDGLKIVFDKDKDPQKGVLIHFSHGFKSYRITEEMLAFHLIEGPYFVCEGEELPPSWSFFKVENSEYLKWASYQPNNASETLNLVHYAIWTRDWQVDILSSAEPDVKLIDIND